MTRPLRILTWHVHGTYLYYLAHAPHRFFVPVKSDRPEGYGGRAGSLPWPPNLHEIPAERVAREQFDLVLFQSHKNYLVDQHEILSPAQRALPRIFLEHDPPRSHPTDTKHPVDDPDVLVVHVTAFNALMWDCGRSPARVIEHGVRVPDGVHWSGERARGLVVVNDIVTRGRRLGLDVFLAARARIPLDLVGMGAAVAFGIGEWPRSKLFEEAARYRFFFNPIRYTSLPLALCEAMMLGMPVAALATTELPSVIAHGVSGVLRTDPMRLIEDMRELLRDPKLAAELGRGARRVAEERFNLARFADDWSRAFTDVCGRVRDTWAGQRQGGAA